MGMMKTDDVLKKVGGATYKTDNMVVVVKKGDSAKNIEDARGLPVRLSDGGGSEEY